MAAVVDTRHAVNSAYFLTGCWWYLTARVGLLPAAFFQVRTNWRRPYEVKTCDYADRKIHTWPWLTANIGVSISRRQVEITGHDEVDHVIRARVGSSRGPG